MKTYWGVQLLTGKTIGIKACSIDEAKDYFKKDYPRSSWIVLVHTSFNRALVQV